MRRLTYIAVALTMLVLAGCADNHAPSDGGLELTWMLQRATRGNGINVVIMGDAYTIDELVHDGKFHRNAITVMESFFSTEPVASMREYFNIYAIGTPSSTDNYNSGTQTYFSLKLTDDGSSVDVVDFDDSKVWRLVRRNIPGSPSKNVVVILHQNNRSVPRDRCLISFPDFNTISFVSSLSPYLISHESVGHGLALLADEYVSYDGGHPGLGKDDKKRLGLGYGGNVDFTDDPAYVKWKHFFDYPEYYPVGVYEGGMYYEKGVWRSERRSIMSCNVYDYFNARSRELIYKRIKELAGEKYSLSEFLQADAGNLSKMYSYHHPNSRSDTGTDFPGTMPPYFRFSE